MDRAGRILHNRAVSVNGYRSHFGHVRKVPRIDECELVGSTRKHRYLLPLTPSMKEIALKMRKPYPKRATSDTNDTPGIHPGERRAARTVALQTMVEPAYKTHDIALGSSVTLDH